MNPKMKVMMVIKMKEVKMIITTKVIKGENDIVFILEK